MIIYTNTLLVLLYATKPTWRADHYIKVQIMVDLQNHFRSGKVSPPMPSFSLSLIPHHYPAGKVIKSCSKTPAHLFTILRPNNLFTNSHNLC